MNVPTTIAGVLVVLLEPQYRDLLLLEPYLWDEGAKQYKPTFNQELFIQGIDLVSIAVIYDAGRDTRIIPAAEAPFDKE
jgi:hypothetical protein